MNIGKLRKKIDKIDKILLKLLENRMKISIEIAKYKIAHNQNVLNLKREKKILKKVKNNSNKKFINENMLLFSIIMYISKILQCKKIKSHNKNTTIQIKNMQNKKFHNKRCGCVITKNQLQHICKANGYDPKKIGKHILKMSTKLREKREEFRDDAKNKKADFAPVEGK